MGTATIYCNRGQAVVGENRDSATNGYSPFTPQAQCVPLWWMKKKDLTD